MASEDSCKSIDFESGVRCQKRADLSHMEHVNGRAIWDDRDAEPPMSSEEEEEVPEDEGPEWVPCSPEWLTANPGACGTAPRRAGDGQTISHYHPANPPPPQPERRPPFVITYSVQGHLYEVALSGDASVAAVDGALIIKHHLGPVAGIVQVLPVINKEGADGA